MDLQKRFLRCREVILHEKKFCKTRTYIFNLCIYVSRCPKTPWVAADDVSVTAVCSTSSLSLQYNVSGLLSKSFQDLVVWVSLDSAGDNQVRGEQRNIAES